MPGRMRRVLGFNCWLVSRVQEPFQDSNFAGGGDGYFGNGFARNLGERVDLAERFQFIAKKFQAHRPRAGRRKQIHDAAAQGDFTFLRDLRFRFVPLLFQPFNQIERRNFIAALQMTGAIYQIVRGKGFLQQRGNVGDDEFLVLNFEF